MSRNLNAKVVIGGDTAGARRELEKLGAAASNLKTLLLGALGAGSARALADTVDGYAAMSARLRLVSRDQTEFNAAQRELFALAQRNQAGLTELNTLYTRLAPAVRRLGGEQREMLQITEAVTLALRVSGATAEESASAIVQLSQGLGAGALRGQDFNAVAAASPRLMQALADGLGKNTGQLRAMAEEGKLTADVVGNALIGQLGKLREEAKALPDTIGGAFTRLRNEFTQYVGQSERVGAGGRALIRVINLIAENLGAIATAAVAAGGALAALKFGQAVVGAATLATSAGTLAGVLARIAGILFGPVGLIAGLAALAAGLALGADKAKEAPAVTLAKLRAELELLQRQAASQRPRVEGVLDGPTQARERRIEQIRREIAVLEQKVEIERENRRLAGNAAAMDEARSNLLRGGGKAEPNKLFEKARKELQDEAIKAEALTRVEEVLREIQLGRYGTLTKAQELELVQLAAIVQRKKAQTDAEKSLAEVERDRYRANREAELARQALIDRLTGRAAAAEQADQLRLIDEEFFAGRLSLEEYDNALRAIFKTADAVRKKFVEWGEVLGGAAGQSIAGFLDDLTSGAHSLGAALKHAVAGFADAVRRFLVSAAAQKFAEFLLGLLPAGWVRTSTTVPKGHRGGIAGELEHRGAISPWAFALAPRFHGGGIVGLRANEVPAILQAGEEVLTRDDPRHSANAGGRDINVTIAVNGAAANAAEQRAAGADLARLVEGVVDAWAARQRRPGGILYGTR